MTSKNTYNTEENYPTLDEVISYLRKYKTIIEEFETSGSELQKQIVDTMIKNNIRLQNDMTDPTGQIYGWIPNDILFDMPDSAWFRCIQQKIMICAVARDKNGELWKNIFAIIHHHINTEETINFEKLAEISKLFIDFDYTYESYLLILLSQRIFNKGIRDFDKVFIPDFHYEKVDGGEWFEWVLTYFQKHWKNESMEINSQFALPKYINTQAIDQSTKAHMLMTALSCMTKENKVSLSSDWFELKNISDAFRKEIEDEIHRVYN